MVFTYLKEAMFMIPKLLEEKKKNLRDLEYGIFGVLYLWYPFTSGISLSPFSLIAHKPQCPRSILCAALRLSSLLPLPCCNTLSCWIVYFIFFLSIFHNFLFFILKSCVEWLTVQWWQTCSDRSVKQCFWRQCVPNGVLSLCSDL